MSKDIKIFLSIILAVTFIAMGVFITDSFAKEAFKIGVAIPLTGSVGHLGESLKNSVLMAQDQMKDKNLKYDYELIFEDTQSDSKNVLTAYEKLLNIDKVDAIFSMCCNSGLMIAPLVEKENKIVHFTITIVPYAAKGLTNFNHWTSSALMNEMSAVEMEKRGIKRVAVFRVISLEGYKIYAHDFFRSASNHNIKIVSDHTFQSGEKNFQTEIAKMKATKPDIIMIFCDSPEIELIAKQIREAGIKTPFTSVESFETAKDKTLFEGMWYISIADPNQAYADEYMKRYGKEYQLTGPNGYDMYNLYVTGVENAKSSSKPTAVEISEEILKIKNFPGALGSLDMLEDGTVKSSSLLKKMVNGKGKLIKSRQ